MRASAESVHEGQYTGLPGWVRLGLAAALTAALSVFGPAASPPAAASPSPQIEVKTHNGGPKRGGKLHATIRRTRMGVPHIRAGDIESLAAGFAYAYAEDNICTIAEEYVTVAAKRSRFFGPDETWTFGGNNFTFSNLDADFYFKRINQSGVIRELINKPPPLGPKRGVRRGVKGYVSGYNKYLKDVGVDGIPDERCRGAEWVRKIKQRDAYRRYFQLGILASSGAAIDGIATAAPASPSAGRELQRKHERMLEDGTALEKLSALQPEIGSNAYGFGAEATDNGKGLVLGNPHFPWDGSERLYQAHLQIPGKINVQGAALHGVPLILIGWTKGLAWSHTVATAWRFTPFQLTLAPGDPYSYVVDGEVRPMKATDLEIKARQPDGSLKTETRTLYETEYGPIFSEVASVPLPWTEGTAFAMGDVNASNFRYLNHFYENNRAQSVAEYDEIHRKFQGIPWVNSIAADSTGQAYYTMQGAIPFVTDAKATECNTAAGQAIYPVVGLPILDGSRSECNWDSSPDAAAPGTFPPDLVPTMFREDYVHNGNDSHWLTNPESPLTGFDRLIGVEGDEVTYRTRVGLIQAQARLAGTDGLPGNRFNRENLQEITLNNRQYLAELWGDGVVQVCDAAPGGFLLSQSGPVDVSGACDPLRNWDRRDELDSVGALIFRRFATNLIGNFRSIPTGAQGSIRPGLETVYTTPYSSSDPLNTPDGLNVANPLVQEALADAVTDLGGAGIPLDAPLGDWQSDERGGVAIPIHGGPGSLGVFNAINGTWNPEAGYDSIRHGSSFMMSAQFTDGGCFADVGTFVTYGQSENQSSPHAGDYTRRFSEKRWLDAAVCNDQIRRQTTERKTLRFKKRPGKRG